MEGFATAEDAVEFKFAPEEGDGDVVRASMDRYTVGFELLTDAGVHKETTEGPETEEHDVKRDAAARMGTAGAEIENAGVPITFIRGELLNPESAAVILEKTAKENIAQALLDCRF